MNLALVALAPILAGLLLLPSRVSRGTRGKAWGAWAAASAAWLTLLGLAAAGPGNSWFGPVFHRGDTRQAVVALSFDDGPHEPYTSRLLDVLRGQGVRATFFLVGSNAKVHPGTVRRIAAEGHSIGNHGYGHLPMVLCGPKTLAREIGDTQVLLAQLSGAPPDLFRPPFGLRDPGVSAAARSYGLTVAGWSLFAGDIFPGRFGASAERMASRTLAKVRAGDVILFHDGWMSARGGDRSASVEAAGILISRLREKGFEFVTVPEMIRRDAGWSERARRGVPRPLGWLWKLRIGSYEVLILCLLIGFCQLASTARCWALFRREAAASPAPCSPAVSVVAACKGGPEGLEENLESILGQEHGGPLEFIFVTPSDSDPAFVRIRDLLARRSDPRARLLVSGARPAVCSETNLNLLFGVEKVSGETEVLVFTDCDVRAPRGWLTELVSPLKEAGVGAVTAPPLYVPRRGLWEVLRFLWMCTSVPYFAAVPTISGASLAVRRDLFHRLGMPALWARSANSDLPLNREIARSGLKVRFAPRAMPLWLERCGRKELFGGTNRWITIFRIYGPMTWSLGALLTFAKCFVLLWGLFEPGTRHLIALLVCFDIVNLLFVIRCLRGLLPDRFSKWPEGPPPEALALAAPLALGVFAVNYLVSMSTWTIAWGGYRYRIFGPQDVEVVGRTP